MPVQSHAKLNVSGMPDDDEQARAPVPHRASARPAGKKRDDDKRWFFTARIYRVACGGKARMRASTPENFAESLVCFVRYIISGGRSFSCSFSHGERSLIAHRDCIVSKPAAARRLAAHHGRELRDACA